ncbi:MAG: hypothetical protein K2V38_16155 [Gemmataceae bacterium]|nr:hypothetical protein [Gemmataceae bacterium]
MRRAFMLVVSVLAGFGCASEREELQQERETLAREQRARRDFLDQNAPVGSRWATHPDTQRTLGEIGQRETRVREIDDRLRALERTNP